MFKWLTHRSFLVNLIAAILLITALAILFFWSLGALTKHGETIKVPDLMHQSIEEIKTKLRSQNFDVVVLDSAYTDTLPPKVVVAQKPQPGSTVKIGRTIYLTLNKSVPPMTTMPELVNYSFRSALMTLENQKLKLGDTIYKPDIAENAVLEQLYQNKPIKAGTSVPEGSKITLVLGNGLSNVQNNVPDLVGLTYLQARELISGSNLSIGVVLTEGIIRDTANAFVFKQNPPVDDEDGNPNKIRNGAGIDLWISQNPPERGDTEE